jgi:outer membrane protein assembly factor BamB
VVLITAAVPVAPSAAAEEPKGTIPSAEAWKIGWPAIHGPNGNFTAPRAGLRLVDDLSKARKVWESEYSDIGVGKCGRRPLSVVRELGDPTIHEGGFSSPIVAEGTVFVAHYRPSGDVRFETTGFRLTPFAEATRTVLADDLVVAIDAETGKTRWVAAQKGQGLNIQMGKRGGWGPTPVYHGGRV